jgi:hypothetical protein
MVGVGAKSRTVVEIGRLLLATPVPPYPMMVRISSAVLAQAEAVRQVDTWVSRFTDSPDATSVPAASRK